MIPLIQRPQPFAPSRRRHTQEEQDMSISNNKEIRIAVIIARVSLLGSMLGAIPALAQTDEPIKPLQVDVSLDPARVALGDTLFHDSRLSKDGSVSCATCHDLRKGGVDQSPVAVGVGGAKGLVNAPTVFNSGLNFRQFWDGRAASLEEQVDGPLTNPSEMAANWQDVMATLSQDQAFVAKMKSAYPDGLQPQNIRDAIATFERSLITPSRFDSYLRGDKAAITAEEQQGYQLFKSYGCIACHQGQNIGGNMFQVFGVMRDYFKERGSANEADLGRYNVTKAESDKHVFKVPSLRNIALTAPYFHNGSAATLDEAVDVMFRYQLGRVAPAKDKALIISFLQSLTGEYMGKPLDATR
jgi:cytochrome c peroxidase